jgi:4-amino-4-deoxy-L-arabinose transferase-like glycosyltransferase
VKLSGDRWAWGALLLVAAGVAFRAAVAFPSHKFPGDADCMLTGITALRLLGGHLPVFFANPRMGAIASYLAAPVLAVFGPSRAALAGSALLLGLLLFAAWCLFLRELLGRKAALAALPFAAFPAAAFTLGTYRPNGFPETLLFCATTLWLAARLARGEGGRPTFLGFGLSAGLGLWTSLLTLSCTVPAAAWMLWRRPRLFARAGFLALASLGFVLGALPWAAFHLRYKLAPFQDNYAVQPVRGIAAMLGVGHRLLTTVFPEMIASSANPYPGSPWQPLLRMPTLLISGAGILTCLLAAPLARWRRGGPGEDATAAERAEQAAWPLCALVVGVTFGLNVVSGANAEPGPTLTVRYLLPIYLVVPAILALTLLRIGRASRVLAALLAGIVLVFNLAGTYWPWTEARRQWARAAADDELALKALERQKATAVFGSYWVTYPFNFLSREAILGIPVESGVDWRKEAERLPPGAPVRLVLLDTSPQQVACWAARAGLTGAPQTLAANYAAFLPPREVAAGQPFEQLRAQLTVAWPGPHPAADSCAPLAPAMASSSRP